MEHWRWPDFLAGLDAGLLALLPGIAAGWSWRRAVGSPAPVWGLLLALGYVLGTTGAGRPSFLGPEALTALTLAVLLTGAAPGQRLLALLGGAVIAGALRWPSLPAGQAEALRVAAPILAVLVVDFEERTGIGRTAPVLIVISCGAVYLAVPDTEHAFVLAGAAIPLGLLATRLAPCRLAGVGAAAAAATLAWTVAVGSAGRPQAVVGGLAAAGLFLAAPLARILTMGRRVGLRRVRGPDRELGARDTNDDTGRTHAGRAVTAAVLLHGLLALAGARLVTAGDGAIAALGTAAAVLAAGAVVAAWLLPGGTLAAPGSAQKT